MSQTENYGAHIPNVPKNVRDSKGKDVVIAILDTGCVNHNDIADNILLFYDAINNRLADKHEFADDTGHGTYMSGIICSRGISSGIYGVASQAKVIIVKISRNGRFISEFFYNGLKWLLNSCPIAPHIINMSFNCASGAYRVDLNSLFRRATEKNIFMVAAGNNNEKLLADSTPFYPASNQYVMAVGSIHKSFDMLAGFNPKINYVVARKSPYNSIQVNNTGNHGQGCSNATALFSGVLALYKSYYGLEVNNALVLGNLNSNTPQISSLLFQQPLTLYKNEKITP